MPIPQSQVKAQILRLRADWEPLIHMVGGAPYFPWDEWKEALLGMTHHQEHEFMVRGALAHIVRSHRTKPSYLVLEDLMMVGAAAHTQAFDFPWINDEEGRMP